MPVLFARLTFSKISAAISILFADKRKNYLAKFLKLYWNLQANWYILSCGNSTCHREREGLKERT